MKQPSTPDACLALPADEILTLDKQLCFALYVASKEVIRKYKPLLSPLGLTYTGYIAMLALWEKDNLTVKKLGEKLFLDSGTLTPLLKKLEGLGYIDRIRSTADERSVNVKLTPKGEKLKEEAASVPRKLLCSSGLDLEETIALLPALQKFIRQIAD